MNLLNGGELLTDLSLSMADVFGDDGTAIDLMVVRRTLTDAEQKELDKQLIKNAASGAMKDMEESLTEGARVDPETSPCGNLTALMMALAAGDAVICRKLRQAGAKEPDMRPRITMPEAFAKRDFAEIARCVAAGSDANTRLKRGQGISATNSGTPLHACCANCRDPGSTEIAQLLINKRADLQAGDAEGDTPLAHAKYFGAQELFDILKNNGAQIGGPYYRSTDAFFGRRS
jgi:hypothetical protein